MKPNLSLPMSTEHLIPHGPPLCLVNRLLEYKDKSGLVESRVGADHVLLRDDGSLSRPALVEMMAQSYAAIKGYEHLLEGRAVERGFLVGVRKVAFKGRSFAGDRLEIRVKEEGGIEEFAVIMGEVMREGKVIASGIIKLWMPESG
ncbi:MAG: 3-hydroxyacyl-ACP dehydratase [Deltaproteobacteria bacterium]|nr:3-hydroxyacyl-ACP dehydratase [Deltaproteobacteria bacterium]